MPCRGDATKQLSACVIVVCGVSWGFVRGNDELYEPATRKQGWRFTARWKCSNAAPEIFRFFRYFGKIRFSKICFGKCSSQSWLRRVSLYHARHLREPASQVCRRELVYTFAAIYAASGWGHSWGSPCKVFLYRVRSLKGPRAKPGNGMPS